MIKMINNLITLIILISLQNKVSFVKMIKMIKFLGHGALISLTVIHRPLIILVGTDVVFVVVFGREPPRPTVPGLYGLDPERPLRPAEGYYLYLRRLRL